MQVCAPSSSLVYCMLELPSHGIDVLFLVWIYAFVAVLVISLLSLVGIAIIPTLEEAVFKKLIIVLVGLAIGTLAGDALLHLIPHVSCSEMSSVGNLWVAFWSRGN